jgi:hypothetical protein
VAKAAAVTAAVVVLAAVTAVAAVMTRSPETPILLMRLVCEDEDFEDVRECCFEFFIL